MTVGILEGVIDLRRNLACFAARNLKDSLAWTVVHVAALLGQAKLLKYLFENIPGVDINMPDVNGMTPLHWVAAAGRQNMVELLLSMDAVTDVEDNWGRLPADLAAWESRTSILELLTKGDVPVDDYPAQPIVPRRINFVSLRVCDSCGLLFRHADLFLRS